MDEKFDSNQINEKRQPSGEPLMYYMDNTSIHFCVILCLRHRQHMVLLDRSMWNSELTEKELSRMEFVTLRLKVLHLLPPNKLVKWRLVIFILIGLIFITALLPYNNSTSVRRPKTNIIFVNQDLCTLSAAQTNNERTAVIIVLSARHNFNHRNVIRQTYGTVRTGNKVRILGVVFMLGNSDATGSEVTDSNKLRDERERFGDIVVGDFVDSYRNLTLKSIMAYEWVKTYCRDAQMVVKTDDDVLVNIYELTKELDSWLPYEVASYDIRCITHWNEETVNDKNSKFYASPVDFPTGRFPKHCGGIGYVTTFGVIERISDEISRSFPGRVCTHEDVFMTGVVVDHINSNRNLFSRQSEPITHRHIHSGWVNFGLEDVSNEDRFLRSFVRNDTMDTHVENYHAFRELYKKRIFFLLGHTDDFEVLYRRLWAIIQRCFSTKIIPE